jgi:hypothetical protein
MFLQWSLPFSFAHQTLYAVLFSPIRGSFPNTPHPFITIALKWNLARCALVVVSSICERMALLSRRYTLKDLPLTFDDDSNRTELYYIIFSLVIFIRLSALHLTNLSSLSSNNAFVWTHKTNPDTRWLLASLRFTFNTRRRQTTFVASSLLEGWWCRSVCIGDEPILCLRNLHYLGAASLCCTCKQIQPSYYAVCSK